MSITLDVSSASKANEDEVLHLMPCKIEYDGEAKIDSYFTSSIRTNEKTGVSTGAFRGRPLMGTKFEIPKGYTGLIMKELHKPFNEEEDRSFKVTHKLKDFTYWNLDRVPSEYDKINQAKEWIEIADALHSPIESEENS